MSANAHVVDETAAFIKQKFSGEGTGHDWWHMYRVWRSAITIGKGESDVDMFVVELAALLHDIEDWKFNDGDMEAGPRAARQWLESLNVNESIIEQVTYIVRHISFKGGSNMHVMQTIEGKIVQDADRLDAIGAIGIGRAFAFGGSRDRGMYDPDIAAKEPLKAESLTGALHDKKNFTTINHFYEKLLLLKDGMHTQTALDMAKGRHAYMETFLEQFYAEWDGKR